VTLNAAKTEESDVKGKGARQALRRISARGDNH